ncbi:helix-turn-helix domain-containing protein [Kribbella sp. C-35]|uniref:helix-turn-helix domain-containing protein n=1 Tax=Kribbella sp. C-35 TaxID=2789276 RepID=UPI0039786A5A
MSDRGYFDAVSFYEALDHARADRNLMWKDVAKRAKVSPSTLTRLAQGRRPDVDSLAALVDWAGLRADDFVVRVQSEQPDPDTGEPLALISTYLRADKNLSEVQADAISKVIRATYDAVVEQDRSE